MCVCVCLWKKDENKRRTTLSDFRKKHLIPILHTFLPFGWVSGKSHSSPLLLPLSLSLSLTFWCGSNWFSFVMKGWERKRESPSTSPLIFNSPFLFSSLIIVFILCALLSVTVWIDIQSRLKDSLHLCLSMFLFSLHARMYSCFSCYTLLKYNSITF